MIKAPRKLGTTLNRFARILDTQFQDKESQLEQIKKIVALGLAALADHEEPIKARNKCFNCGKPNS